MPNWKEQFLEWIDLPRNRSRLIASVIGLFVLFGAVFFFGAIDNLLSLFGSKAGILPDDLTKPWEEAEIPEELTSLFSPATLAMEIELDPSRTLVREDISQVLDNLQNQGYHLQLAPTQEEIT